MKRTSTGPAWVLGSLAWAASWAALPGVAHGQAEAEPAPETSPGAPSQAPANTEPAPDAPPAAPASNELRVAVVAMHAEDALDQADALTRALKSRLRHAAGFELQDGDWALELLTVTLGCPDVPDAACETKIADNIAADRFVWGVVKRLNEKQVRADIHMWTRGTGRKSTSRTYASNLTEAADEALVHIAGEVVDELTGGMPNGRVKLRVGSISGNVYVGDELVGTLVDGEATIALPAGRHTIVVRGPTTVDLSATVEIKPLTTAELKLVPMAPESGPDWQKIMGFSTIGLGLGFGVVGLVSSIQIQSLDGDLDELRQEVPPNEDVCDYFTANSVTRGMQICSDASTFETLQMVMYPLAAVSVGTGIVLLATADWSGKDKSRGATPERLSVRPNVGLTGGDVTVRYAF